MKQKNQYSIRRAVLRFSITRKKFGVRVWPVRSTIRARAPSKENS